jgi:hypothetical protein
MAATIGAAKGQGVVGVRYLTSWRAEGACWRSKWRTGGLGVLWCLPRVLAEDDDDVDSVRASAGQWGCLGGSR